MYHGIIKPLIIVAKVAANLISLNTRYEKAVRKMEEFAPSPEALFDGSDEDLAGDHLPSCKINDYMTKVSEAHPQTDETVKNLLAIMCRAGAAKLTMHASEHFTGGEYWENESYDLQHAADIAADSTNNAVEKIFVIAGL